MNWMLHTSFYGVQKWKVSVFIWIKHKIINDVPKLTNFGLNLSQIKTSKQN